MRLLITAYLFFFLSYGYSNETINIASKYNNFISHSSKSYFIQHERKEIFQVKILKSNTELSQGFSGIRAEQVEDHQGLFFWFPNTSIKNFWMPNTFFDLRIIYLDKNLKVVHIIEKAPHHIGFSEKKQQIYRAPGVKSRYVLEIKASSAQGKKIKVGDLFKWIKENPTIFQKK